MDWVDKPQNYKGLYGILQLLQGSHLNNFLRKTPKLGWVAFHSAAFQVKSGAIIGDGDRKSWNPRGPMIWDNFSIFRTNCAILTSYIRADPRTCRGFSRGCFLK